MADGVFNIAKGRINELMNRVENNDPADSAIVIVLLRNTDTDAVLEDFDTLQDLLNDAQVDEADFTNYVRKILTDVEISAPTVDDINDRQEADLPDQVYSSAGGAANNNLLKLIVCYDSDTTGGDDSQIIPLTHQDFVATTDGNDLTATINNFFRAA